MTSIPDTHRDLLDAQVATLATIGSDGRPQQTALWFLAEGDVILMSLNNTRQKVKNLQHNPACSLLILDPGNPYRYLEVRGDAVLEPDPDNTFAARLGAKYGSDVTDNDGPGESRLIVTLRPSRIHVWC
jgi:PPOX class probable F420-dependent enzyme